MIRSLALILISTLITVLGGCRDGATPATPKIATPPMRISGSSPFEAGCASDPVAPFGERSEDAEVETDIAVNPNDPDNIVIVWMQDIFSGLVSAATRDGGAHWTIVPVPGTSACSGGDLDIAADPTVAFGPDGTAYLSGFSLDLPIPEMPLPQRTRLFVTTSDDGGFNWKDPVEVVGGYGTLHDMPTLTPDPVHGCKAYVLWTENSTAFGPKNLALEFSRTNDCGATWAAPVPVFTPTPFNPFAVPAGQKLLVHPDGSLIVVVTLMSSLLAMTEPNSPEHVPDTLAAFRSQDGGTTWSTATQIAAFPYGPFNDPDTGDAVLASSFFLTAGMAPDGAAYVAYRSQLTETTANIQLVKSTDGGVTWSKPKIVHDANTQMMTPALAVGRDGAIAVTYYDIRNDLLADLPLTMDFWLSESRDGGESWAEVHVAGPFDLRMAANLQIPTVGLMVGEYSGLAAIPGGYAASFVQSGAPAIAGASDVFFAKIPGTIQP